MKNPVLLVISDTHGSAASLTAVLFWAQKYRRADALAFLGDGAEDLPAAMTRTGFTAPWKAVCGNGDYGSLPSADTLEFAGHRFYLTHGHLHRVNEGFDILVSAAQSRGADAALYGHTHVPFWEEFGGLLVLNPGSLGRPRTDAGPSFATIECPPGEWFKIRYWGLKNGPLGKSIRELEGV